MQEELLNAHKDTDFRVYAVWFSMYPGDDRERWPSAVLPDRRVLHYWDERAVVGGWYGARLTAMEEQLAPGSKGVEPPVLWDAYLVYGPEARWDDAPTGLRQWGRTILLTSESFRKAVGALAKRTK